MLEIKGFLENSLIEWDGKLSSVIFLPYCNFRCPWCHVPDLAFHPENLETVPFSQIEEAIKRQQGWLDGIAISGGEPTIHPELPAFIAELRRLGMPVKIETNGTAPQMLKELLSSKLIDSVAMDIKNQISEPTPYERTVGVKVNLKKIEESIEILMGSSIDYEFRTTVVPTFLDENDIVEIARSISGAKRYILQQFAPRNAYQPALREVKPYPPEKLKAMAELASRYVHNCQVRGI